MRNYLTFKIITNKLRIFFCFILLVLNSSRALCYEIEETDSIINFADEKVKAICVKYWDTNGDSELSINEAAAVTTLNNKFQGNQVITSFNELKYFTNLKIINKKEFYSCKNLISVTIPENVTTISDYAFNLCLSLDSITLPNSVTKIKKYAFSSCNGLRYATLPETNVSIEEFAFLDCKNLHTIILHEGITNLYYVFSGCKALETINIPESVLNLEGAFSECSNLKSIVIPQNVKKISSSTFEGCYALENIVVDTENSVYDSRDNCNAIIEKETNRLLFGSNQTTIIPNGVTSIADKAFYNRTGLKEITLPSSLTSIGNQAFYNCEGLKEITIPSNITFIGNNAFYGCNGLTKVVSKIEEPWAITAFTNTIKKNAILVVPQDSKSKYETINGWSDFLIYGDEETAYLKKYTDTQGVLYKLEQDSIGFYYSVSGYDTEKLISNVSIPEDIQGCVVRKIYAFNGAEKLHSISLPSTLNYIGNGAFRDCFNLKRVYSLLEKPIAISSSTTFPWNNAILIVPKGARTNYKNATHWKNAIIFEDGDTIYEKKHTDNQGVKYTLYEKDNEFYYSVTGCSNELPVEVVIPTDIQGCAVTEIASSVFADCIELEKVVIPKYLTSLYVNAFIGCTSLKEIVSQIQDPSKLSVREIKKEVYDRTIFRVPIGTKGAYLNSSLENFFIYEEGENIIHKERYPIDEQGVKYQLAQTISTFYYKVIGHTDGLPEHVTIPEDIEGIPVNALSGNAFKDCTSLKWISLPHNIVQRYDSKSAFDGCSLTLELNAKGHVSSQWRNSNFIKELVLGHNVDTLYVSAFSDCVNLTEVTFPNELKIVGDNAFSGCTNLKHVNSLRNLRSIGYQAFYNCKNLATSLLLDSLQTLKSSAFENCEKIDSVVISNKLTTSGSDIFSGCTGIKYIEIHTSKFPTWFSGLPNIAEVHVGSEVKEFSRTSRDYIGITACPKVEIIVVDSANSVFDSRYGCNAIIRSATNELIRGCNSTIIPEDVISISSSAFSNCTDLSIISIPAKVASLGTSAFSNCTDLKDVISHIKQPYAINSSVFDSETYASATLSVPYGCTKLYKDKGWNFETIVEMEGTHEDTTYIQFNDSLTKNACVKKWDITGDGEISLYEASLVTSVNFESNKNIVNFDELQYFTNITSIKPNAFTNCTNLTHITLPDGVTSIGKEAFAGCISLETFEFPHNVTNIEIGAFWNCSKLRSVILPDSVKNILGSTFAGCLSLESVLLPQSLKSIGNNAFKGCSNLISIMLPEGLTSIGEYAFNESGLSEINLPSSLISIGDYALAGKTIHCKLREPINVGILIRNIDDVILYVPQGCEHAFKNAPGWKDFIVLDENIGSTDWQDGQLIVNIETPGQLRLTLIELEEEEILRLKICGALNSEDLKYLTEGKGKISNLESLDLSDVTFIYDGGCYKTSVFDGISDVGFMYEASYYYLTEESYEKHNSIPGIAPKYYHYYYGPDLAGAFEGLPYKHIVMPRGINKAAFTAFRNCANLQKVEYPSGLQSVESQAFKGCKMMLSINLEQVDTIGNAAFSDCKILKNVKLDSVKYLEGNAFSGCSHLVGDNDVLALPLVDSIPSEAFYRCLSLKKVKFSQNLYYIGNSAFANCNQLSSVDLPSSLNCLSSGTFENCTKLKNVNYSDKLMRVHYSSFDNTHWWNNLPVEKGVKYMKHIALCIDNVKDFSSFRNGTTTISDYFMAYYSGEAINLTLPESLLRIGDYAFSNNNFKTLNLPKKLIQIGEGAFKGSHQLTKVTLPENLQEVGEGAFAGCNQLSLVNYDVVNLNAKEIFKGCLSLEKVNIGGQVRSLPEGVFEGCSNLAIVKFMDRTEGIPFAVGASTFSGCTNLINIQLPIATNEIGKEAFSNCTSINTFVLPQGVSILNEATFANCTNLNSFQFHNDLKIIGNGTFSGCCQIKAFELPEGLDSIGTRAFEGCILLQDLTIPSSVAHLGEDFLRDCYNLNNLTSLVYSPQNLNSIISMSNTVLQDVFGFYYDWPLYRDIHYDKVSLIVPKGSKSIYRQTNGWKKFTTIIEHGDTATTNEKYLVTFKIGDEIIVSDSLEYGDEIIVPEVPTKEGHTFSGWSEVPATMPEHDVTIEGCFIVNKYLLTYVIDDEVVSTDSVEYGATLVAIEAPTKEGYTFSGWNDVPETMPAHDVVIRGYYEAEMLVGDVNADGDINVSDVSSVVGMLLNPDAPAYNKAADVNSDGIINVSDVSAIVGMLLSDAQNHKLDAPAAPATMTTYNEVTSSVFIEPFQINPGEEKEILVNLNNPDLGVISFQFDLTLPEGLEILYDEEDGEKYFYVDRGSRLPRSYVVESNQFANGTYRILAYSNKNDLVKETSGDIIAITVKAADTMPDGIYTINFVETVLTEEVDGKSVSVYPENTSCAVSVGNATGIEGVSATNARKVIYDLQGRPTDAKKRGIYIINGKKVMK